jgi:DNA-binding CsgD family transcriptional regulator
MRRLLAEARGNPLALLDLPALLDDSQAAQNLVGAPSRHVSSRLHEVFAGRVAAMPLPVQRILLMAALDGTGDLDVLMAAGEDPTGYLERSDDLIGVDPSGRRIVFRHPIVRSAVLAGSTGAERQHAHRLLADALRGQPARRVWHLAAATTGPDEEVAASLEDAAHRARSQGDPAGAMSSLLRAAELTPDPHVRARRLGEAAYLGADLTGDLTTADHALVEGRRLAAEQGPSLQAAAATAILLLNGDGDLESAIRLLTATIITRARHLEGADEELISAVYTLLELNMSSVRPEHWQQFHRAVNSLGPQRPPLLRLLVAITVDPLRTAVPALPELAAAIDTLDEEAGPVRIRLILLAALAVDRMEDCRDVALRVIEQARVSDAPASALPALLHLAIHEFLAGRWVEAESLAREGADLSARLGYRFVLWPFQAYHANLAAVRGDVETVRELSDRIVGWATPRGSNSMLLLSHYAQQLAALGAGDFEEAYRHVVVISAPGTVPSHSILAHWVVLDLVEAAVRTGRHTAATEHVAAFQRAQVAALSTRAALLVTAAAAVAAVDGATELFEQALAIPHARLWTFEYARVQLLYGEHLRRARAAVSARIPLDAALRTFEHLGAQPWARRAGIELKATGAAIRDTSSPLGSTTGLTPQESEVVSLATSGLTNTQIAQRLQISRRTVSSHLYRAFAKLGVSSRAALGAAVAARSDHASGPGHA